MIIILEFENKNFHIFSHIIDNIKTKTMILLSDSHLIYLVLNGRVGLHQTGMCFNEGNILFNDMVI